MLVSRRQVVAVATALIGLSIGTVIGATTSSSTTTRAVAVAFPTPANTGVPAGVALTPYSGPTTLGCGVVIDRKVISGDLTINKGNGFHDAAHPCVTITNSRVNGIIDDGWTSRWNAGPVVIADSEIANPNARDVACVSDTNLYLTRLYVHGCRSGVQTDGFVDLRSNYLLADVEFGSAHMDAFITNGNYGQPLSLVGNSFLCAPKNGVPNGAGCAADVGTFGDFSAVTNMTMTGNIFRATGDAYYCFHTPYEPAKPFGGGGHDTITNNVFERGSSGKCAGAGPVYAWSNSAGTWCANLFDDGTPVLPGNADNCGSVPPTTVTTTTVKAPTTLGTVVSTVPPPTSTTSSSSTTSTTRPTTPTSKATIVCTAQPLVCGIAG